MKQFNRRLNRAGFDPAYYFPGDSYFSWQGWLILVVIKDKILLVCQPRK